MLDLRRLPALVVALRRFAVPVVALLALISCNGESEGGTQPVSPLTNHDWAYGSADPGPDPLALAKKIPWSKLIGGACPDDAPNECGKGAGCCPDGTVCCPGVSACAASTDLCYERTLPNGCPAEAPIDCDGECCSVDPQSPDPGDDAPPDSTSDPGKPPPDSTDPPASNCASDEVECSFGGCCSAGCCGESSCDC